MKETIIYIYNVTDVIWCRVNKNEDYAFVQLLITDRSRWTVTIPLPV